MFSKMILCRNIGKQGTMFYCQGKFNVILRQNSPKYNNMNRAAKLRCTYAGWTLSFLFHTVLVNVCFFS